MTTEDFIYEDCETCKGTGIFVDPEQGECICEDCDYAAEQGWLRSSRDEAMEWDSWVLASAGWGTDEDYGY